MDRTELCARKYGELFGGEPVKDEGSDPEFLRILQRFIFGEVCQTGDLDDRMRELVTVTVLCVNQTLPQLKAHASAALNVGCTPAELREAVYQCAPLIGFPKTLNAIAALDEVFAAKGIALPLENRETVTEETRADTGRTLQEPFYGTEIRNRYASLPAPFGEAIPRFLTELCFGDFMSRSGPDRKTRELLSLTALAALGDTAAELPAHAAAARKAGCSDGDILAALTHALPYMGFPRTFNALDALYNIRQEKTEMKDLSNSVIFPLGNKNDAYAQYFDGQSYLQPLTGEGVAIANVTFEPACRNHWHIHHKGGQILLVTGGRGWYQEWNKPARELRAGDVVNIPPEVKHWHGAAKDSWFVHLAAAVPAEGASCEWLEPVEDADYKKLK